MSLFDILKNIDRRVSAGWTSLAAAPTMRPVPFYWQKEMAWANDVLTEKEARFTWTSAGYVEFHSLSVECENSALIEAPPASVGHFIEGSTLFDFEWRLEYLTSGSAYGIAGNNSANQFFSRQSLGNSQKGENLRLSPLKLYTNDSILLTIKPLINEAVSQTTNILRVMFSGAHFYA